MNTEPASRQSIRVAQAWIALVSEDPTAVSTLAVARARLTAGRELTSLMRLRIIELYGALPPRPRLERLLHSSTQFYNPHKERCTVRLAGKDAAPVPAGHHLVAVTDRGDERRIAAERWWRHQTGRSIEVREGVVWVLGYAVGAKPMIDDLVVLRDRRHGLLCNPQSQDSMSASGKVPLPWITPTPRERS